MLGIHTLDRSWGASQTSISPNAIISLIPSPAELGWSIPHSMLYSKSITIQRCNPYRMIFHCHNQMHREKREKKDRVTRIARLTCLWVESIKVSTLLHPWPMFPPSSPPPTACPVNPSQGPRQGQGSGGGRKKSLMNLMVLLLVLFMHSVCTATAYDSVQLSTPYLCCNTEYIRRNGNTSFRYRLTEPLVPIFVTLVSAPTMPQTAKY